MFSTVTVLSLEKGEPILQVYPRPPQLEPGTACPCPSPRQSGHPGARRHCPDPGEPGDGHMENYF